MTREVAENKDDTGKMTTQERREQQQ